MRKHQEEHAASEPNLCRAIFLQGLEQFYKPFTVFSSELLPSTSLAGQVHSQLLFGKGSSRPDTIIPLQRVVSVKYSITKKKIQGLKKWSNEASLLGVASHNHQNTL